MVRMSKALAMAGLSFALALSTGGGSIARAQSKKFGDKDTMRVAGIALGALAAHQALKGKTTNALILGAGAAYAGKRYEDARKAGSRNRDSSWQQGRRGSNDEERWRRNDDRYDGGDRYDERDYRVDSRRDNEDDARLYGDRRYDERDDRYRHDSDEYGYDGRERERKPEWGQSGARETLDSMGRRRGDSGLHLGHYKTGKGRPGAAAYARKNKPGY
jgi:hypothetical protein